MIFWAFLVVLLTVRPTAIRGSQRMTLVATLMQSDFVFYKLLCGTPNL
eukprot:COSAG06_NODE_2721_length_6387_cov_3.702449_2_plen_48_part_00